MTIAIVRELEVRPGREAQFEQAYGPSGLWASLFGRHAGFRGTELLRDGARPGTYITIDRWDRAADFAALRTAHGADYEALDTRCEVLTVRETRLGMFETV